MTQYDGVVSAGRREIIDLEIGDAAGEHWIALDTESANGQEADYVQWMMSAQVIVHVISIEALVPSVRMLPARRRVAASQLARDAEDLKLVSRLMRSARKTKAALLVVISKTDAVTDFLEDSSMDEDFYLRERLGNALFRLFETTETGRVPGLSRLGSGLPLDFSVIEGFCQDVRGAFASVDLTFSSVDCAIGGDRSIIAARSPLLDRLSELARDAAIRKARSSKP